LWVEDSIVVLLSGDASVQTNHYYETKYVVTSMGVASGARDGQWQPGAPEFGEIAMAKHRPWK